MVGASQSWTITVKLRLLVLPQASVATQVTALVPIGKLVPGGGLQTTNRPEEPPAGGTSSTPLGPPRASKNWISNKCKPAVKTISAERAVGPGWPPLSTTSVPSMSRRDPLSEFKMKLYVELLATFNVPKMSAPKSANPNGCHASALSVAKETFVAAKEPTKSE